jgi:branched-chain amino acid transport system ATP-binding protein
VLLSLENVSVQYQKVAALKGISMGVPEGGIVTIIGANGAGKSTTLRAVSGLVALSEGEIRFADERIDGTPPERIVAAGIAHVPEGRRIFPDLTVLENLSTGAFLRNDKEGIARDLDVVFDHFPRLKERRSQWGKTLSGGEQQMLAIGRALMSNPKLLLLDEPSMGLSPIMVQEIAGIVLEIRKRGRPAPRRLRLCPRNRFGVPGRPGRRAARERPCPTRLPRGVTARKRPCRTPKLWRGPAGAKKS